MSRAENIFLLALSTLFAVCAVGAASKADWPMAALYVLFVALLLNRGRRKDE